jgi:glycosyltransferase involved in cell wall biosynthesis
MTKILFYTDAAEFGGHEAMTLAAIEHLSAQPGLAVSVAFYQFNEPLRTRLESLRACNSSLSLRPLPFMTKRLQAYRSILSPQNIHHISTFMQQIAPDTVIVSQGRIEASSAGLLAAKRAGFRTISYLPMAHPAWISGNPIPGRIRDLLNRYFYRLPDKFITISESARAMLRQAGSTCDIAVVPNFVQPLEIRDSLRHEFRRRHGLADSDYVVAIVGRIDFRQKGQEFALRSIARFRDNLLGLKFLFVGDGPDHHALHQMIPAAFLTQQVLLLPWQPNRSELYSAIDMLLIPSKFEGVPLVMLEAMLSGRPIVASNVDAMADQLPPDWLFPYGNAQAMIDTILYLRAADSSAICDMHRQLVATEFTFQQFVNRFTDAVLAPPSASDRQTALAQATPARDAAPATDSMELQIRK